MTLGEMITAIYNKEVGQIPTAKSKWFAQGSNAKASGAIALNKSFDITESGFYYITTTGVSSDVTGAFRVQITVVSEGTETVIYPSTKTGGAMTRNQAYIYAGSQIRIYTGNDYYGYTNTVHYSIVYSAE